MSIEDGECSGHPKEGMRKLSAKWVPGGLTFDQIQRRVDDSEQYLKMIKRNKPEFFHRYVKMDKTWVHHFTPKSNRQSFEWTAYDEPAPKCLKTQQSAGKVMALVFSDAHGKIFIDYLEKGRTINSEYYIALYYYLKDEIAEKRPHLKKKEVLLYQDNVPKIHEMGFKQSKGQIVLQ
ncbi:hypothetical protein GWI33_009246 [Rhynchophorus ferrugineus]|uniref:Transposase n=1 Tax=Rhynchophorus ferrugineus TaxID=354439 RepID=A0A834MFF2_RHYFE|nr:hypothetical protein GWI33_009246 [Rhynchophorus ferrugineus]